MSTLANMIQCEIGILTNIGTAHDEGFSNTIEKIEEKIKLFKNAKIVICNGDNEVVLNQLTKQNKSTFTWGFSYDNALNQMSYDVLSSCTKIEDSSSYFAKQYPPYAFMRRISDMANDGTMAN